MYKVISLAYDMDKNPHWNNFCDELFHKLDRLCTVKDVNLELKRFDAKYVNDENFSLIFETEQGYVLYLLMYS